MTVRQAIAQVEDDLDKDELIASLRQVAAALEAERDEAQALIYAARQERDAAEDAEKEIAEELRAIRSQLADARMQSLADLGQAQEAYEAQKAAEAERDEWQRLYWLVRSFAVHDDDCTINRHPHYRNCSCGLRAALTTPEEPKP